MPILFHIMNVSIGGLVAYGLISDAINGNYGFLVTTAIILATLIGAVIAYFVARLAWTIVDKILGISTPDQVLIIGHNAADVMGKQFEYSIQKKAIGFLGHLFGVGFAWSAILLLTAGSVDSLLAGPIRNERKNVVNKQTNEISKSVEKNINSEINKSLSQSTAPPIDPSSVTVQSTTQQPSPTQQTLPSSDELLKKEMEKINAEMNQAQKEESENK